MTCEFIEHTAPDGSPVCVIVCSRGRRRSPCSHCGRHAADLLCDYPLTGKKAGKTCDRKLCRKCAVHLGGLDFCPPHSTIALRVAAELGDRP